MENQTNCIEESFKLVRSSHRNIIIISLLISAVMLGAKPSIDTRLLGKELSLLNDASYRNLELVSTDIANALQNSVTVNFESIRQELEIALKKVVPQWQGEVQIQFTLPVILPRPLNNKIWDVIDFWTTHELVELDGLFSEIRAFTAPDIVLTEGSKIKLQNLLIDQDVFSISIEPGDVDVKPGTRENGRCGYHTEYMEISGNTQWRSCLIVISNLDNLVRNNQVSFNTSITVENELMGLFQFLDLNGYNYVSNESPIRFTGSNLLRSVAIKANILEQESSHHAALLSLTSFVREEDNKNKTIADVKKYFAETSIEKTELKDISLPTFGVSLKGEFIVMLFPLGFTMLLGLSSLYLNALKRIIPEISTHIDQQYPVIILLPGNTYYWGAMITTVVCLVLPTVVLAVNPDIDLVDILGKGPMVTIGLYTLAFISLVYFGIKLSQTRKLLTR